MNSISELVAQLGSDDQSKAYQARKALQGITSGASKPGNNAEQTELAKALASELTAKADEKGKDPGRPKHSAATRNQIAQFLSQVAGDDQIPALAKSLKDLESREMARWALERIASPAATAALVAALDEVGPEFLIGVINALGKREGPDVNAALVKATSNSDPEVRLAAIEALANHPEPSNDEPIVAATKTGPRRTRSRAQRARCRLADSLRLAGKKDAAVALYKAILATDADEPQKKAATIALEQLT